MLYTSLTVVNNALFVSKYKVYLTGIYFYFYFYSVMLAINKHDIKRTIVFETHGRKQSFGGKVNFDTINYLVNNIKVAL